MFRAFNLARNLTFGAIAAILFCIPVFFYIRQASYKESWLLYVGTMLFFAVIVLYNLRFNQLRNNNANTVTHSFASHITTAIGVIISCLICFILLSVMIPGYLGSGPAAKVDTTAPPNTVADKTNGLSFHVFIAATIFNFSFGSFAGIMLPFTIKKNQKNDSGEPYPLQNKQPG